ncbi:MAG: hypothetical protein ACFHWX_05825 [Bacteroidota bacterium]
MVYETTLKFKPEDFRNFYEGWIKKSKPERNRVKRTHLLTSIITLTVAILILTSNDVAIQLVFVGLTLFGVAIFHFIKLLLVIKRFNSAIGQIREQLADFLSRHQNTDTMGLKITDEEIQYFENSILISTNSWNDINKIDYQDDHFMLYIGEPSTTLLIPKFGVSEEFYDGVLGIARTKDVR